MARKSRTPPPPRRAVQAPKRRAETRDDAAARRRMLMWIGIVSAVLIVIAAILTYVALGAEGTGGSPAAIEDAGCTLTKYPAQPREHVAELEKGFKYNSDPPSSGPHSNSPGVFGVYGDPVDPLFSVHAMEHGGVVVQYGEDVPGGEVDRLLEWYRDDPNGIIVAPLARMKGQIALTAWNSKGLEDAGEGVVAKCPGFDEDAFDAFLDEYGFKGPESDHGDGVGFAREDLKPGT